MAYTAHTRLPVECTRHAAGTGRIIALDYDEDGDLYARIAGSPGTGNVCTLLRLRVDGPDLRDALVQAIGRKHAVNWTGQWYARTGPSRFAEQTGYLVACSPAPSPSTPLSANDRA